MKTTTISIEPDLHFTAIMTVAKGVRGGFSGYLEQLIKQDLVKHGISVIKKPTHATK